MIGTRRRLFLGHSLATTHPSSTPHPSIHPSIHGHTRITESSRRRPTNTPPRAPEQSQNNVSTRGSSTLMNDDDEDDDDDDDEPDERLPQDGAARGTHTMTQGAASALPPQPLQLFIPQARKVRCGGENRRSLSVRLLLRWVL
ncbi:hypothetical protein CHARACLAT_032811 [Characodon lateralis]|uniref:Uncharacterized protein n=1 Tax=Characodon lateralis TaxID=208331 RepID=A0ABU7DBZ8_9TELE|nr:hypothetical protein [Characodon lateralis]